MVRLKSLILEYRLFLIVLVLVVLAVFVDQSKVTREAGSFDRMAGSQSGDEVERSKCVPAELYKNTTDLNIVGEQTITDRRLKIILGLLKDNSIDGVGQVLGYSFDQQQDMVAYITETGPTRNLYLLDLQDFSSQLLTSIQTQKTSYPEYELKLNSVTISPDATKLIYATTTKLYEVDLKTKETKLLLEYPDTADGSLRVYQLKVDNISTDNRYVVVTEGLYEGSSAYVFDIQTQAKLAKRYGAYVAGSEIIGWDQDKYLVEYYSSNLAFGGDYQIPQKLVAVSPLSQDEEDVLVDYPFISTAYYLPVEQAVYVREDLHEPSGEFMCVASGTPIELEASVEKLIRISLVDGKQDVIVKTDNTRFANNTDAAYGINGIFIMLVDNQPQLVVSIYSEINTTTISTLYYIDDASALTKISW